MKDLLTTVTFALFVFVAPLAQADTDRAAEVEERLAQAQERLNLSEEQKDQLAPIMEESMAARKSILSSYGIDPDNPNGSKRPNFRQARSMRSELEAVRSDTLASLEGVLSDSQLEEFKRMQEEQRAAMRERMRSAR